MTFEQLDPLTRLEVVQMIYKRWAEEFDLLKTVKAEKPDANEPDWQQLHDVRLKNHTASEAKWKKILSDMIPFSPLKDM